MHSSSFSSLSPLLYYSNTFHPILAKDRSNGPRLVKKHLDSLVGEVLLTIPKEVLGLIFLALLGKPFSPPRLALKDNLNFFILNFDNKKG